MGQSEKLGCDPVYSACFQASLTIITQEGNTQCSVYHACVIGVLFLHSMFSWDVGQSIQLGSGPVCSVGF